MGVIPEEVIDDIRTRIDIVEVIGQHVELRKAGRNHKGLCPFHHEKTPSFNVSGDRGFFYCFGCHKKGDAFTFVMEYEGKSFVEAAEALAARYGIDIPETQTRGARGQRSERGPLLDINRTATEFFCRTLADGKLGAAGRQYLQSRGVSAETAEAFRLGYAPDQWNELGRYLQAKGLSIDLACKVGLLIRRQRPGANGTAGTYDRFRNRLMCPIILPGGEVAGFSGRQLPPQLPSGANQPSPNGDGKQTAKYINSPESPVYKKSKLLFGLQRARDAFREAGHAIVVEGNFDVITMHQAGFTTAVAPLGTALTPEQVAQLRRLVGEVVLLYDGDNAGRSAALKALETLVSADVKVRIVNLPTGQDPDSMLANGQRAELAECIRRAQPGIEYFVHEVWTRSAPTTDGRTEALETAARLVQKVANPTKRDLIAGELATAMGIDVALVQRTIGRKRQEHHRQASGAKRDPRPQPGAHLGPQSRPQSRPPHRFSHSQTPQARVSQTRRVPQTSPTNSPPPPSPPSPSIVDGVAEGPSPEFMPHTPPSNPPKPPSEELALLAILADHPQLFETAEEQDVFSLLTDARLRDMYCAARQGGSLLTIPHEELGPWIAQYIFAGTYATVQDPVHCLKEAVGQLRNGRNRSRLANLQQQAQQARRRGDVDLERKLVTQILQTRRQVD